jgi:hypothetical protein
MTLVALGGRWRVRLQPTASSAAHRPSVFLLVLDHVPAIPQFGFHPTDTAKQEASLSLCPLTCRGYTL